MATVQQKMALGIVWMVLARLADRSIGLISTIVLARLLVPDDFGLIAMATAFAAILELFGAFNFDLALIQRKDAETRHYDTAWTFNVIFGLTCALIMVVGSPFIADFYNDERVRHVLWGLALAYFIGGLTNIGVVNFRKELDFRSEFTILLARRLITFTITLTFALLLRSYWALVIGIVVGRIGGVAISYHMHHYRPQLCLRGMTDLMAFSKWLLVNNLLFFLIHRGMDFVIGRTHGTSGLGVYSVSYEISNIPTTDLVAPINRATFPGFSKLTDRDAIADVYLRLFGMICLIIVPIGVGIGLVADPLVRVVLGDKWLAAIPLISILSFHGAISASQTNNGTLWMSMGRTRLMTANAGLFVITLFGSLFPLLDRFGIIGAGYAYLCAHAVCVPISTHISIKLLGISWVKVLANCIRPATGIAVMTLLVTWADASILDVADPIRLLSLSVAGAVTYTSTCLLLWKLSGSPNGAEAFVIEKIGNVLRKYRPMRARGGKH